MAQIFDSVKTKNTVGFVTVLCSKIGKEYGMKKDPITTPYDIAKDKPLLVMCQNYSRIAIDIKDATQGIRDSGIPDHLVAVVIIHAKEKHALPTQTTSDTINDGHCKKFGLLVDFAYLDGHLLDCEMNTKGDIELRRFLKKIESPKPDVGTETTQTTYAQTHQGANTKSAIQFLSNLNFKYFKGLNLRIPGDVQVVRSMADLRRENMWIVMCYAGSFEEEQLLKSISQNAKILVLIYNDGRESTWKAHGDMLMIQLDLGFNEKTREKIQAEVSLFIKAFTKKDVSEIFIESKGRIEVYTDDVVSPDIIYGMLGIKARMVSSLPDLTKQDYRIIWVLVCKNESPFLKNASEAWKHTANAKVILVVDDCEDGDLKYEQKDFLLTVSRLHRDSLPLQEYQREAIKANIRTLMETVQERLLQEPLEKLFLKPKNLSRLRSCLNGIVE